VKYIELSQGARAKVDDADYKELSKHNWSLSTYGYAVRNKRLGKNSRTIEYMHKIVCSSAGSQTDHINGDRLDNRRANLRLCSPAENARNRKLQKNSTSGYSGVLFHKANSKWKARIKHMGDWIHLGYFIDKEDAIRARSKAEDIYFGKFSRRTS